MMLRKMIFLLVLLCGAYPGVAQLTNKVDISQGTRWDPIADSGTTNAYVVNVPSAGTTLRAGLPIVFMAANTNTGPSTLNLNSTGAIAIQKRGGTTDVDAGDLQQGGIIFLVYDGTVWQLVTTAGTGSGNCGTGMTPGALVTAASATDCQTPNPNATLDGAGNMAIPGQFTIGAGSTVPALFDVLDQTLTPVAPVSGRTRFYTKGGELCYENPAGTETCASSGTTVNAYAAVAHQWLDSFNATTGNFHGSQPAFSDISGTAALSQIGTGTPASGKYVDGGTGAWTPLPPTGATTNQAIQPIGITVAGTSITTGSKGFVVAPFAGTITGWSIITSTSCSAQFTIKKASFSSFPTTSSIVASAPITLSSAQKNSSATLTGWTTTVSANDVFEFNLDSISGCTWIAVQLPIQKT